MSFLRSIAWAGVKLFLGKQFSDVAHLSPTDLANWLAQAGKPPFLLDARTAEEYAVSHLPHAHLASKSPPYISGAELDSETPIVVYCSIGYRSAVLARKLQAAGYKTVFNLEGSIFQWANEGHPVFQNHQIVNQVHPYNAHWGKLLNPEYR